MYQERILVFISLNCWHEENTSLTLILTYTCNYKNQNPFRHGKKKTIKQKSWIICVIAPSKVHFLWKGNTYPLQLLASFTVAQKQFWILYMHSGLLCLHLRAAESSAWELNRQVSFNSETAFNSAIYTKISARWEHTRLVGGIMAGKSNAHLPCRPATLSRQACKVSIPSLWQIQSLSTIWWQVGLGEWQSEQFVHCICRWHKFKEVG